MADWGKVVLLPTEQAFRDTVRGAFITAEELAGVAVDQRVREYVENALTAYGRACGWVTDPRRDGDGGVS